MKKLILITALTMAFMGFGRTKSEDAISLDRFFPDSEITYSGGFEDSNFKVITKKTADDKIIQKFETTATITTRVIKITPEAATLVFSGSEDQPYKEGEINKNNIIIKLPLTPGNTWESDNNKYTIDSFDGKTLQITRKTGRSAITTVYFIDKGMISETFESEGLKTVSKIIEK